MNDDSIKIMSLLDELEELINSSGKMPFSEKGIIDLDVAQKIIEDMRLNLPRDIQQAKWLGQEKDRIIKKQAAGDLPRTAVSVRHQIQ